ncbi:MAG: DUF4185 domain-containing protein [Bacteroidota bacterium]
MRNLLLCAFCLLLAACDATTDSAETHTTPQAQRATGLLGGVTVEPAPAWTDLFDTTSGWTGADGIYSIPVNGVEVPGTASATQTIFLFNDTAIGDVLPDGRRAPGSTLVNNTVALLGGGAPDPSDIEFFWPGGRDTPRAAVVPDTPDAEPGDWYWNADGIVIGNTLWAYYLRVARAEDILFPFELVGANLARTSLAGGMPGPVEQFDTPLFRPAEGNRGNLAFGGAILPNLAEAGVPNPDGFLYVYGVRNDSLVKKLLVARVRPQHIADFERYRYWDGAAWVADLDAAVPVTNRVSNELSVTPLANGKYLLVFQRDAISSVTAARVGDSPVGPWGPIRDIYSCPEVNQDSDYYCYNAKAHPHLSEPGTLLISYNVNTFDFFGDFFSDADLYRPRFIRLRGLPQ